MAFYKLENECLRIKINSLGAELVSLQQTKTNQEYMWEGNPQVWGRISPILFPFVGGLKDKEYKHNGKTYPMSQHGFARDMDFSLLRQTENSLWFTLTSTKETEAKYPFPFLLEIGYELKENSLEVLWNVTNTGDDTMYFSIGGHPGFTCPFLPDETQTDCYIGFDAEKEIISSIVDTQLGLLTLEKKRYKLEDGLLKITSDIFDQDALVIENHQAHTISLVSSDKKPYLSMHFDAPLFGIWSMPHAHAPYICIEPWYGRCDKIDFDGTLSNREWGNSLDAGDVFRTSYTITL